MEDEAAMYREHNRVYNRLMRVIESVKGKEFSDSVKQCIEESEPCDWFRMELVSEPIGDYQTEEYEAFEGIWVQQWSVGDSGDSFQGYVCIKLKDNMYLKFRYSM